VFALFLGVAMCVSAIPVIAKTLTDMNLLHRNIGQLTLAAGMVDDVFGWLMLSIVSAMATTGVRAQNIGMSLLYLAILIGFALVIGRPAAPALLRLAGRSRDPGPTLAVVVAAALLGAAATQAMGLEAVVGAFVAGILIGTWGRIEPARIAPLRTTVMAVLAPIFFATAGLRMDLTALRDPEVLAAAVVVLLVAILGKFAGAYLGARISRLNRWEALALGAGMNARGVVEVVVAMVGLRLGVLTTQTYTIVIVVAIVTSVMAPPILRIAMRRVEHTAEERLRAQARQAPTDQMPTDQMPTDLVPESH
jgi:Kef-type K+ transport system membrane component KefB